ncbi:hypothetical protein [Haloprofundus salinisoli]|uniref:hypothetical protein n=1 Tax=Haloprofundus salinisoli TaxID=2876193 RepID=UPI001CC9ABC2|nr:hypothetical protein [Haloprofundus salinisoli]
MSQKQNTSDTGQSDSTRRTVLKASALSAGGLALGLGGTNTAAAQQGGGQQQQYDARMFVQDYRPGARLQIVSNPINYTPQNLGFTPFNDYNTRIGMYRNTNERVLVFTPQNAQIQSGQSFTLQPDFSLFQDND